MIEHTKETINETLGKSIAKVVFKTVKGGECTKYATLQESFLPPPPPITEGADDNDELKKKRKVAENKVNFWSVEDNGWRSFLIENLTSITVLTAEEAGKYDADKQALTRVTNAQTG